MIKTIAKTLPMVINVWSIAPGFTPRMLIADSPTMHAIATALTPTAPNGMK